MPARSDPGDRTARSGRRRRWAAADWAAADAPLLWRFHLYYWDWAWALAAELPPEDARAAVRRALEVVARGGRLGPRSRLAPVPGGAAGLVVLRDLPRAWSEGSAIEGAFRGELAAHAGFLRRNLETDVGGNHLIKNLKALAGLAVFFGDDALLARTLSRLRRQLAVQVLPDGGHYERAPAYHCQVLGDLIDIAGLLRAAGLRRSRPGWPTRSTAMRSWLGAVLDPGRRGPAAQRRVPGSPGLLAALRPSPPPAGPLHVLPDTGLARAAVGGWHLLADVGPALPARAARARPRGHPRAASSTWTASRCSSTPAPPPTRPARRATASGPPPRTTRWRWTAATPPRSGARSGPAAGPGCARAGDVDRSPGRGRPVTVEAAHDGYRGLPGGRCTTAGGRCAADELRVDDTVTGRRTAPRHGALAPGPRRCDCAWSPGGAVVTIRRASSPWSVTGNGEPALAALTAARSAPASAAPCRRRCSPAPCTPSCPSGSAPLAAGRTPTGGSVKQIVQPVSGGPVTLLDVPCPVPEPTEVLVRTVSSVISPGTERAVTALAQSSLLAKARARPDLVRQVVTQGPHRGDRRHPPDGARPPGAGRAARLLRRRAGARGRPRGHRGPARASWSPPAGRARRTTPSSRRCRACSARRCRPGEPPQDAAFTTIASIALHGLRIAEAGPGSKVVVVGLGLIGQLAARLAMAAGCDVAGIDPAAYPRDGRRRDRRARARRARRRDHRAGARLVPRPGRGRGAGLRGRARRRPR